MSEYDDASESRKRPAASPTHSVSSGSKRSKSRASPSSGADKTNSRGLRHFSMMVCKKVEEMGTTTHNQVADELVKQEVADRQKDGAQPDEKNIRRRVYDALNVLMAMDIISKDKKAISWQGLPTAESQSLEALRDEIEEQKAVLQGKRNAIKERLVRHVSSRNLIWHNHQRGRHGKDQEKIPLPFLVVNTNNASVIQCEMNTHKTNVMFDFTMPFEINDDNYILKKMGLDKTTMPVLQEMLPAELLQYCEAHRLTDVVLQGETRGSRHNNMQYHSQTPDIHVSHQMHSQHYHYQQPAQTHQTHPPHLGYHHQHSHSQGPPRGNAYPHHHPAYAGYEHMGPEM